MQEKRTAEFSACRKYRYTLKIRWDDSLPLVQFIGLNPSTADETKDDPTLRRVKGFAAANKFGGVVMTNLFAWRSTDPRALLTVANPIGEQSDSKRYVTISGCEFQNANDFWIVATSRECKTVVAAWGTLGNCVGYRASKVKQLLKGMQCLKLTAKLDPAHPLYLSKSCTLQPFN